MLSKHLWLRKLWGGDVSRVFPPCDTTQLAATVGDREGKEVSSSLALWLKLIGTSKLRNRDPIGTLGSKNRDP